MTLISFKNTHLLLVFLINFVLASCAQESAFVKEGAAQIYLYADLLKDKNIAVVANQTSVIYSEEKSEKDKEQSKKYKIGAEYQKSRHLVDSLLSLNINIKKVFAPEHGFRGNADAGELIKNGIDAKTGLPIISLYGKNKKPTQKQLEGIDIVVFDIQDVGARFYTYISTLHYVMEACAEMKIPLLVLDRPNPNAHYIDGPVLETIHQSFVGMHPVPVVYGMTIGEYGKMINGEKWLKNAVQCNLTVVPLKNYTHNINYSLPIKPSPNLPNDKSINLYPSLCFFEGTHVSVGRGTRKQFQIYGSPFMTDENFDYCFTPQPNEGAKYPKHQGKECCGVDLSETEHLNKINLKYLIASYSATLDKTSFFNSFFTKLAGTKKLRQQIEQGLSEEEIKKTWQSDIEKFKRIREKYLLYK